MKKPRKFLLFFLLFVSVCIVVAIIFHEVVVYTSNAYIRANWAAVSPRVKGHVKAVHVQNNALVKQGQLMIELEEYPYRLVLDVHKATLAQDQAQLKVTEVKYEMARETLKSVTAEFKLAVRKRDRFKALVRENAVSKQKYEDVETELDNTTIRLTQAKENVKYWMATVAEQATVIDASRARVALAEYDLSMCRLCAPNPGFVNNMYIRPRDYAVVGEPMFGIVETTEFWVEANYKESHCGKIKPDFIPLLVETIFLVSLARSQEDFDLLFSRIGEREREFQQIIDDLRQGVIIARSMAFKQRFAHTLIVCKRLIYRLRTLTDARSRFPAFLDTSRA